MTSFLEHNADYLAFVFGLSLAGAAALCFSLYRRFAPFTAQLRDSERRYRALFDSSPNAIIQLDDEGRVLGINRYGLDTMGRSEADTTGWSFPDLFCLPAQPQAQEALAQVRAGGFAHFDAECPNAEGTPVAWHVMLRPIGDEVGAVRRLVAICLDITERKRAEETLSATNQRLMAVNEIARAVGSTLDQESVMRTVVREVRRVARADGVALMMAEDGKHVGRIVGVDGVGAVDPQAGPGAEVDFAAMGLIEGDSDPQPVYSPDLGHVLLPIPQRLVELGIHSGMVVPIVADHLLVGCVAAARREVDAFSAADRALLESLAPHLGAALNNARAYGQLCVARAEQTRAMQRLTAVNEIARALASTLDQESVMRIVLQEVGRVVPYDRASLVMCDPSGERGRFVAVTGDSEFAGALPVGFEGDLREIGLDVALHEGREVYRPDMRRNTEPVYARLVQAGLHSSVSVPIISDNLALGCLNVSRRQVDAFSEREQELLQSLTPHIGAALNNARAYEQLRAARLDLQKAQEQMLSVERLRSIGEVAGGVAHNFNNILGVILNRTQILLETLDHPAACASLRLIETAARDGRDTVKRIQHFVSKHSDEAMVVVNLNDLVTEALQLTAYRWKNMAEREGVTIRAEADLGATPLVRVNPAEIREVLINLIINACDALPHGGLITVRTYRQAGRAALEVSDTGAGMDAETAAHIFDLFFTTKGAGNTGLGLAISDGIVQRHGGKITVCSDPGQGTMFTVTLPLTTERIEEEPALTSTPPAESLQVLVVDDDPMVREALQAALDAIGYPAVAAPSGLDAVNLVKQQSFDVVVTDLGMPGMSGWKVAEEVKRLSPRTQVMILTGWGDTIEPTRFVDETLSKPLELSVLREVMSRAVARKAA